MLGVVAVCWWSCDGRVSLGVLAHVPCARRYREISVGYVMCRMLPVSLCRGWYVLCIDSGQARYRGGSEVASIVCGVVVCGTW